VGSRGAHGPPLLLIEPDPSSPCCSQPQAVAGGMPKACPPLRRARPTSHLLLWLIAGALGCCGPGWATSSWAQPEPAVPSTLSFSEGMDLLLKDTKVSPRALKRGGGPSDAGDVLAYFRPSALLTGAEVEDR
jgi:hypothetical protein